jgi:hypothetical protein
MSALTRASRRTYALRHADKYVSGSPEPTVEDLRGIAQVYLEAAARKAAEQVTS